MMRCCDGEETLEKLDENTSEEPDDEETPEKPDENIPEEPDDEDTLDKPDDEKIPEIERMMEKWWPTRWSSLVVLQKISRMPKKE